MIKKILFLVSFILSVSLLSAEALEPPKSIVPPPPNGPFIQHRNFHGKRMMDEEIDFQLIFVKSTRTPEAVFFEVGFSQPINPETANEDNFLFNGDKLSIKKFRFSRNYRIINYLIKQEDFLLQDEPYTFEIKNIESIKGETAKSVEFKEFQTDEAYRYSLREEKWKKF